MTPLAKRRDLRSVMSLQARLQAEWDKYHPKVQQLITEHNLRWAHTPGDIHVWAGEDYAGGVGFGPSERENYFRLKQWLNKRQGEER